jgi:hypothetical protein
MIELKNLNNFIKFYHSIVNYVRILYICNIKKENMKELVVKMLKSSAESDKAKALLSLELLCDRSVGIGDHSTKDFYSNAEEALSMLADAEDRLEII